MPRQVCDMRQERWKSDVSSFEMEQKLGGMGIGKEKSWRKEYKRQGDQTKTSTKRKAADVTLPTDVQMCRAEVEGKERCGCRARAGRGMEVEDREPLGSAQRYMYCAVPYFSVCDRPAYP